MRLSLLRRQGYQAGFQRSCVVVKMYSPLRRRFVLDFGKQTAAWRRLQWDVTKTGNGERGTEVK